jgi:hypothetical protein
MLGALSLALRPNRTARVRLQLSYHNLYTTLYTQWSFHDLPCAASQLHVYSVLPVLLLVLSPEEVTLAVTVTRLPAATSHGNHLTMPLPIQLDRH